MTQPTPDEIKAELQNLPLPRLWRMLKLMGKSDIAFDAIRRAETTEELNLVLEGLNNDLPDASSGTRRKWKKAADARRGSLR